MNIRNSRLLAAATALLAISASAAHAASSQVTLSNTAWTLVGSGSISVIPNGQTPNVNRIIWQTAASTPSSSSVFGLPINTNGLPTNISAAGNIYARVETFDGQAGTATLNENDGAAFTGTFSWPGSCGNVVVGSTPTAGCTAPVVIASGSSGGGGSSGFTPSFVYSTSLAVTTTSSTTPVPTGTGVGSTLKLFNRGPYTVFWTAGATGVATATPSMAPIPPNSMVPFVVPSTVPAVIAAVTGVSGQTATLNVELGSGLASDTGGPVNTTATSDGTAVTNYAALGGSDNTGAGLRLGVTAAGTPSTKGAAAVQGITNGVPLPIAPIPVTHPSTTALAASLSAKTTAGFLMGFNCTGITGGAAGYCVVVNAASVPATGALTGSTVLDFCQFDTTAGGCSLGRAPSEVAYSAGIQVLVTTAASPYTYTTGTDTAAISADIQ